MREAMYRRRTLLCPLIAVSMTVALTWLLMAPDRARGYLLHSRACRHLGRHVLRRRHPARRRAASAGDSQVVIRIKGASEHHVFNRRGKIGGIIWGGIEHVTFRNAPSFYAVYTSASLEAAAGPARAGTTPARLRSARGTDGCRGDEGGQAPDDKPFRAFQRKRGPIPHRTGRRCISRTWSTGSARFDAAVPLPAEHTAGRPRSGRLRTRQGYGGP